MNNLQKMGGVAALIEAATYVIGLGLAFTLLAPVWELDPDQYVALIAEDQATWNLLYIWHLLIFLVNGVFLVVLALALHERLKDGSPAMSQTAAAFGLIWAGLVIASGMVILINLGVVAEVYDKDPAQAATVWLALDFVANGLGGGNEIVGGLWVLLWSWAALRAGGLPKALNYLGVLVGVAGIVTLVPALGDAAAIFGLGFTVWFAWVGIVMLRSSGRTSAAA